MSAGDTARVYYTAMRGELNQHLEIVHQTTNLYLGAVTLLFGAALKEPVTEEVILIVPFLSMSASIMIGHHERVTGTIAAFCAAELDPFLREIGESAPQWDNSHALDIYQKDLLISRFRGTALIVFLPGALALGVYIILLYSRFIETNLTFQRYLTLVGLAELRYCAGLVGRVYVRNFLV
jgi:hypothetical protein